MKINIFLKCTNMFGKGNSNSSHKHVFRRLGKTWSNTIYYESV